MPSEIVGLVGFILVALLLMGAFTVTMSSQFFAANEQAQAGNNILQAEGDSVKLVATGQIAGIYYPGVPGLEANGGRTLLFYSTPYTYQYQVPNNYLQTYTYQLPNNQLIQYSYSVPDNYLQSYQYTYYETTQTWAFVPIYSNVWVQENIPIYNAPEWYYNPTQGYQLFTYNGQFTTAYVAEINTIYEQGSKPVPTGVTWRYCNTKPSNGVPNCPPGQPIGESVYIYTNIVNSWFTLDNTLWQQGSYYCLQQPVISSSTYNQVTQSTKQLFYFTTSPENYTYPTQGQSTWYYTTYTSSPVPYSYTVYQSNPQTYQYITYYSTPYTYNWSTPQNTQNTGVYYVNVTLVQNGRYEVVQVPVNYTYYDTAFQSNSATAYQVYSQTNSTTQYGQPITQTYNTYYYSPPQPLNNSQTVYYIQENQFSGYTQPNKVWYTYYYVGSNPTTIQNTQIQTDYSTLCPQPVPTTQFTSVKETISYKTETVNPPASNAYPVFSYGSIYSPAKIEYPVILQDSFVQSVSKKEPAVQYDYVTLLHTVFQSGGYYETTVSKVRMPFYVSVPVTRSGTYWATKWNTVSDNYWVTNGYITQTGSYYATSFQNQSAAAYNTAETYLKYTYWNATITNTGASPFTVVYVVYQGPRGTYTVPLDSQPSWSVGSWLVGDGWQPPPSWSNWQSWSSSTGTPLSGGYYGYQWGGSGGSGFPFAVTGSFTSYGVELLPKQSLTVPFAPGFEVGFVLSDGSVFWIS